MTIRELTKKLEQFNPDLPIAAYLEPEDRKDLSGGYELEVPSSTSFCELLDNGGIKFMVRPAGREMLLLDLNHM